VREVTELEIEFRDKGSSSRGMLVRDCWLIQDSIATGARARPSVQFPKSDPGSGPTGIADGKADSVGDPQLFARRTAPWSSLVVHRPT